MTSQTVNNVIKLINIPEKNKLALKGTECTYDLNHFGYFHPNIIKNIYQVYLAPGSHQQYVHGDSIDNRKINLGRDKNAI